MNASEDPTALAGDLEALVATVGDLWRRGNDVREWPADEAEHWRTCDYRSFSHREELHAAFMARKAARLVARTVLDLGWVRASGEVEEAVEFGVQHASGKWTALGVVSAEHAAELTTDPTSPRLGWTPVHRTITTIRGPWQALAAITEPSGARGGEPTSEGATPA